MPASYDDLLDEKYKKLISMPNPASSGTGYMFLRQFTNEWGEDEAFAWFDQFTENVLSYTSSGSGPINALVQGEVGIGLGMTSQAVVEINEGVTDLEILFFAEGLAVQYVRQCRAGKERGERGRDERVQLPCHRALRRGQ